jgi:endonuclease III
MRWMHEHLMPATTTKLLKQLWTDKVTQGEALIRSHFNHPITPKPKKKPKPKPKPKPSTKKRKKKKMKDNTGTERPTSTGKQSSIMHHLDSKSKLLAILDGVCIKDKPLLLMMEILVKQSTRQSINLCKYAIQGLQGSSLTDIFLSHHTTKAGRHKAHIQPPKFAPDDEFNVQFLKPGIEFLCMAREVLNILETLLMSLRHWNLQPIQYNWEFILLSGCDMVDGRDDEARRFAMLVCLILSAASTDRACIDCTVHLWSKKLLSPEKLSTCPREEVLECIDKAGIGNIRATHLIETSKKIMTLHKGRVPCCMEHLLKLPGVGKKTATIMRNEAFGFFSGIGVDKHIIQFNRAFGLLECDRKINPEIVECAMGTWVPVHRYKEINCLIGSFAQVFTQDLRYDQGELEGFVVAIFDFIKRPFQIEALFFMIKNMRILYKEKANNSSDKSNNSSDKSINK